METPAILNLQLGDDVLLFKFQSADGVLVNILTRNPELAKALVPVIQTLIQYATAWGNAAAVVSSQSFKERMEAIGCQIESAISDISKPQDQDRTK